MTSINGPQAVPSVAGIQINNDGLIVGWSATAGSHEHASVWQVRNHT